MSASASSDDVMMREIYEYVRADFDREDEEIRQGVVAIVGVVREWVMNETDPDARVATAKALRRRLAYMHGGKELADKFAAQRDVSEFDLSASASVPISVSVPPQRPRASAERPATSSASVGLAYAPLALDAGVSVKKKPPPPAASSAPSEAGDSLHFDNFVGEGLEKMAARAKEMRRKAELDQVVKDTAIILCKYSMF